MTNIFIEQTKKFHCGSNTLMSYLLNKQNNMGWSGGAMVLGKLPVPGRPTIWMIVGQGPIALAIGAVGVVWTFLLSSTLSLFFLPLFGSWPDID